MNARGAIDRRREAPYESAGQLYWLVGAVVLSAFPHTPYVNPWIPAMVTCIALWRIILASRRGPLPPGWIRVPLTIIAFAGVLLTYRKVSGLDAGSSLLLVMAALKLLETRGRRDRAVVVFICYFLLFATFLREQAVWSPIYLCLAVWLATTALVQTARSGTSMPIRMSLMLSARIILQALPLMALLFLLFPRVPGPFWALPQTAARATVGLSESMQPGDITQLALSDKIAFRARFTGPKPASADLYWRGPVLGKFDGRGWQHGGSGFFPDLVNRVSAAGTQVSYDITLEPSGQRWLLALETPVEWDAPRAFVNSNFVLKRFSRVDRRLTYNAKSQLNGTTPGNLPGAARTFNTELPAGRNPRTVAWARERYAQSGDNRSYLQGLLNHFQDQPFFYTLTPPALGSEAVDEFLFDTREGFCGHYASAFAVLARAAGIPARIVTGYQGGELNPWGGHWVIRQADAHAWVEVWLDDRWERIDPTAAVAPDRIEFGMDTAVDRGTIAGAELRRASALLEQLALSWDAINAAWNRWVLAFGPENQASLLEWLGIREPNTRHLVALLTAGTLLSLSWLAWQFQGGQPKPDPLERAYALLCRRTARLFRARYPQETATEYAEAAAQHLPEIGNELQHLFRQYNELRYENTAEKDPGGLKRTRAFAERVRAFKPARPPEVARPA